MMYIRDAVCDQRLSIVIYSQAYEHILATLISLSEKLDVVVYSKSEYTLKSVCVSGRPAVNTITLQKQIRLS